MCRKIMLLTAAVVLLAGCGKLNESKSNANRILSKSHLQHIGMALLLYANDNNSFPVGNNVDGLSKLKSELTDSSILICPSTGNKPSSFWSSNMNCDYLYSDGMSVSGSSNIGIACDKPGNFKDGGNILFIDGQVKFFSGKNWIKNANNTKLEQLFKRA